MCMFGVSHTTVCVCTGVSQLHIHVDMDKYMVPYTGGSLQIHLTDVENISHKYTCTCTLPQLLCVILFNA